MAYIINMYTKFKARAHNVKKKKKKENVRADKVSFMQLVIRAETKASFL